MEINGKEEAHFDFRIESSSSKSEGTKLALVHFPQAVLQREAKNVEYTDGSDSIHSYDDEKETNNPFVDKKVVLSIRGGFKELDILNYSSLSQIQGSMDEGKKGKMNVCQVTVTVSLRKIRRGELIVGPLKPKKLRKPKKRKLHIWIVGSCFVTNFELFYFYNSFQ